MADMRIVRPPCDNKIRNFTPLSISKETLHITTPEPGHPRSWELFVTSEPVNDANQVVTSSPDEPTMIEESFASFTTLASGREPPNEQTQPAKDYVTIHPVRRASPLTDKTCNSVQSKRTRGSDFPRWAFCDNIASQTKASGQNEHPVSIQTPHSHCNNCDTTHSLDMGKDAMSTTSTSKCPVMKYYTGFSSPANDSMNEAHVLSEARRLVDAQCASEDGSLVDVREEELDELPQVTSPAGVFSPAKKAHASPSRRADRENTDSQSGLRQADEPTKTAVETVDSRRNPGPVFKRSVSSYDFEEPEYTSFFGSLQKRETELRLKDEDDPYCPDFSISPLWRLRKQWDFNSSFQRAHSADSFVEAAKRQKQNPLSDIHSLTPVERLRAADDEESEREEQLYGACGGNPDRMKMRRGALAQPERMIMSQAVREKVQKEVEKRKTSMVRRVSQFFNVQLGLNREEDLI